MDLKGENKMNIIEKAKLEAKQLINKAYQIEEIYRKMKNYYPNCRVYVYANKEVSLNMTDESDNFSKFKHLFIEDFEDNFDVDYKNEGFNEYGGFYHYRFKYLDVDVNFYFYPNSSCELIEEEVVEKRFRMKC